MIIVGIAAVFVVGVAAQSVRAVIQDVRALNRSGRRLTDRGGDVNGVSPAGVTAIGNNITH